MNLAFLIENAHPARDPKGALTGEDRLVYALKNPPAFDEAQKPELVDLVTRVMEGAKSSPVRNAAALFLTDLIGQGATERIVNVIRQPGMPKSAGSLLFALNDVEASLPLDLIVDIIEHGSLEAQGEALTFLEDARIADRSTSNVEQAEARLRYAAETADSPKTRDAASIALEFLDELAPKAAPGMKMI